MLEPRIPLLDIEDAKTAATLAGVSEQFAELSVFRILLRHPGVTKHIAQLLTALLFTENKLEGRLRELIIMRIGWVTSSSYEWTQHWRVATGMKIPEEDLLSVRDWQASEVLDTRDRAVLKATDDVLQAGGISDAAWQECCQFLDTEEERIELALVISNWIFISQILKSLKVPLEEGVSAWPPDGKIPA
ncbi:MAG: carboxymuconolactone decarboxylase family protein [Proteobacteria bacterium]|nr:carboxymuconolactone decarboxylase family protein [Pseudomonadota bacterium]